MGRILIDALIAGVLLGVWYLWFARHNRRRGTWVLRWVESALAGKGQVFEAQWLGASHLRARLRFPARWFENARVTVRLLPRPLPLQWLISVAHKQKETLTFEADLDYAPGFDLDVSRHRWLTHSKTRPTTESLKKWAISRPGPIVLTTRAQWAQDLTPVVNALMTARGHNLLSVRFRPQSPHFTACVALETLSADEGPASFLTVMRELAAGASTKQL